MSYLLVKGSDLGMVVRYYMWPFPPGTRRQLLLLLLLTAGLGIQWRVSSAGKGGTPAVGREVLLRAPPAHLGAQTKQRQNAL